MGFTREYIKDKHFVLTLIRDGANDKLLEEHVHSLTSETEDMHPFVELADATQLQDLSGFTELGASAAGAIEFERKPYKKDKLAILVSTVEAEKLAHGYSATSFYFRYNTRVFRDFRQAIEWLGVADLENEINELRNK
jgi:hypothetical protein